MKVTLSRLSIAHRFLLTSSLLALTALAIIAQPSFAANGNAVVSLVQAPAFLNRNGLSVPLSIETDLLAGDVLRTGSTGRVQLALGDGSLIKLGANAQFQIDALQTTKPSSRGFFKAAFNVVTGAFRFTTNAAAKLQKRDVSVRVRTVTAGIRGTDLWGRSDSERDLICLLEGAIDVTPEGEATRRLDQALDFIQKSVGQPSLPISKVDSAQIQKWAAETEPVEGNAAQSRAGQYQVVIKTSDRDSALSLARSLQAAGYAPSKELVNSSTVRLVGFVDQASAEQLIALWKASGTIPDGASATAGRLAQSRRGKK